MEESLNLVLNLIGTFAFGLSGGILAVKKRMDLFGVLVLSESTGLGGGIVRDLILGHTPPATLTDWRYLGTAGFSGVPAEILAAIATFTLRMVSLRRGWRIPIAMPKVNR